MSTAAAAAVPILSADTLITGLKHTLSAQTADTPVFDQLLNALIATPNTAIPNLCFDLVRLDGLPVILDCLKTVHNSKLHTSLLFLVRVLCRDDRHFPAFISEDAKIVPTLLQALAGSQDPLALHTNCEVLSFLIPASTKAMQQCIKADAVGLFARALVASTKTQGIDNPELLHHTQIVTTRALMIIAQSDPLKYGGGLTPFVASKAAPISSLAEYAVRVRAQTPNLLDAGGSELFNVVLALLKIVFVLVITPEQASLVSRAITRADGFVGMCQSLSAMDEKKDITPSIKNLAMFLYSQSAVFKNGTTLNDTESGIPPALSPSLIWQLQCSNPACTKPPAGPDTLPSFARCSKCKIMSYCSKPCQAAHWSQSSQPHKAVCFELESKMKAVRPTPTVKPKPAPATATATATTTAADTKSDTKQTATAAPATTKKAPALVEVAPPPGITIEYIKQRAAMEAAAAASSGGATAPPASATAAMAGLNLNAKS